jgi:hypothetical protein
MQVSGNSVVLVVTRSDLAKPGTDGRDRVMTSARQLRFDCLELGYQPLLRRLAPHDERSIFPALPTVVSEAQKREGFRFSLSPLLSVLSGEPPKLDQPCLLRM